MRRLQIDRVQFEHAFDRDVDFENDPQSAFLDGQTGEVLWVFEDDEDAMDVVGIPPQDNADVRHRVEADPDRFLAITGLDHADHHDLLREFLTSDWTPDQEARARARDAYAGSIGGWKRSVPDTAVHAFHAFCDRRIAQIAEAFLRKLGIAPDWK